MKLNILAETSFSTFLQVGLVVVLAALLWRFASRRDQKFTDWIGLNAAPARAVAAGAAIGLVAAAALMSIPAVEALAHSSNSVAGKTLADGVSTEAVVALILLAIFKTALAEELLFRGLIGKRLIARAGFAVGNSVQALLFGAVHLVLLLSPAASTALVALMVLFSAASGLVNGWLNEKLGGGSILPGWAAHGCANLAAYLAVAFSVT